MIPARTRRSRQRDRILEILERSRNHPTANWIYARLRKEFPDLSMGTVYRNLGVLVEQGLANSICESCGSVTDLEVPVDETLTKKLREATGLRATRHEIRLYGTCRKCER